MQRALQFVLVAVLITSAGCLGDGGGTTPTAGETTAADTPGTATAQTPPGISESGVENASAILDAHRSYLQNRSYTVRTNGTTFATNGSVVSSSNEPWTFQVGKPGEGTLVTIGSAPSAATVRWYNDTMYLVKLPESNFETYQRRLPSNIPRRMEQVVYRNLENATAGENTTTRRVTRNGRQLFRVQGLTWNDTGSQRTSSLSLLVDSRGVIWEYEENTTRPARADRPATYRVFTVKLVSVNDTDRSNRPDWFQTAIDRTTPVEPFGAERPTDGGNTSTP